MGGCFHVSRRCVSFRFILFYFLCILYPTTPHHTLTLPSCPAFPALTCQHEYAGKITFTLASLIKAPNHLLTKDLVEGRHTGSITMRAESIPNISQIFTYDFSATDLPRMNGIGVFAKSDPFIEISRLNEDGFYTVGACVD